VELSVLERLILVGILPSKGNATTLKLVRQLREELSFDEDEHELLNFIQEGENIRWNQSDTVKDVEIGPKMMSIIVEELSSLDEKETLNSEQLALYEKFIETTE